MRLYFYNSLPLNPKPLPERGLASPTGSSLGEPIDVEGESWRGDDGGVINLILLPTLSDFKSPSLTGLGLFNGVSTIANISVKYVLTEKDLEQAFHSVPHLKNCSPS